MSVRHLQHEWPQSKEDRHDFGPLEKPQQVHANNQIEELVSCRTQLHRSVWYLQPCCKEEWYVGDYSRVDAEHALHLANTVADSLLM